MKHISHGGLDSNSVKEGQEMLVPAGCSQCPLVSFFFFFSLFNPKKGASVLESVACGVVEGSDAAGKRAST